MVPLIGQTQQEANGQGSVIQLGINLLHSEQGREPVSGVRESVTDLPSQLGSALSHSAPRGHAWDHSLV